MSFWMRTIRKLISIARGTYNARKFWTRRTSGSVRGLTVAWKYAYKNLTLHSGSPTHSVVTRVRSSARDRSSRIDYWTLNSRNVNSMFAASGWFFHSGSHIIATWQSPTMLHSPRPKNWQGWDESYVSLNDDLHQSSLWPCHNSLELHCWSRHR